jgi:hypothetical protein
MVEAETKEICQKYTEKVVAVIRNNGHESA